MTTGLDYIKRKYGKDNYLDFHEEARAYNQGVLDAIDALAGKLDDIAVIKAFLPDESSYFLTIWLNSGRGEWCKAAS